MSEPAPFRVLCVDDERDVADSAALLLTVAGFEVRACYDAPSALEAAAAFRPSLFLIDLNMPGMAGDELARRLRACAVCKPSRLVAVTAMSDEHSRSRTRAAGFDLHLVKPVDPRALLDLVRTLAHTTEGSFSPCQSRTAVPMVRPPMQHKHLRFGHGFRVVLGDGHSQAAQMTLGPGEAEGGPGNRHRGADQWLYVVSGAGLAVVNGETVELREGTLLLIQRGDEHEVRNTGEGPLRTLNVYVPPAYTEDGEELPPGRS